MRRSSYFHRIASCVESQALHPPRPLFGSFPSVAVSAGTSEMPERDAIRQPVVHSKIRPVTAAAEAPRQPQPTQMPSPTTTSAPSLREQIGPAETHPAPALKATPVLLPFQDHTKPAPAAQLPVPPRQPASQTAEASETPIPIEPAVRPTPVGLAERPTSIEPAVRSAPIEPRLADSAVARNLSAPARSDSQRAAGLPATSDSVRRRSAGSRSGREIAEKMGVLTPDVQKSSPKPLDLPIRLEPPVLEQRRSTVENSPQPTGAAGRTIHIGSLEIKIMPPPPPPPPSQAPPPVRKASAAPPKPISRAFATFGIAQGY
jgi:hypothetical protein